MMERAPTTLRATPQRVAILLGLGILTVALLLAFSGGADVMRAFADVHWLPVALAIAVHYSGFAVRGHRWQQLLHLMGHRVAYLPALALLLAGWFASALLPARAGDALRIYVLHAGTAKLAPVPVADSLGSIVLERVLDMLAILLLGASFGLFALRAQLPPWVLAAYVAALAVLLIFGIALLVAPRVMDWLHTRSTHRWWQAALGFIARFVASLRALARRPQMAALLVIESFYIWLCDALLLWLVLRGLAQTVPFAQAAFVALTVDVIAAVPVTPGGIGQIEAAHLALLALAGVPATLSAAAVLLVRAISYWTFLIVSGIVTAAAGFRALLTGTDTTPEEAA